ncbi:AAA family ATPase [Azospirillum picis]|uniref:Exonuclease SbcC n=1 Tax=Azospirillum picis TaxID=488438 RepID=A0ABU0MU43_9PROT|nr:AAA family ATPase [Azospirillum picis]MBP2303194.1 exonuclease SbcC [Azospirillum picis]MDQ0536946.1 exonuclease SbcC [Azospirillum picis]
MRILAVRGANLTSLDGPFAIEFDAAPLRRAGLFAITGPTGAGKSTILDALCLALFDRMPRLPEGRGEMLGPDGDPNSIRTTDVRTILRRGAGHGWAEVDFVGVDGHGYRARWEVRRARQKAQGALQQQSVSLASLDGEKRFGDGKKSVLEEIEKRLGLSFEQFRRAVLLAQGDFATFLKAPARDRSALLELLTGTEIYSRLSIASHERAGAERQDLDRLEAQGGGIGVLGDEDRTALQQDAADAADAVRHGEQTLMQARAALAWHERDAQLAAAEARAAANAEVADRDWHDAEPRRAAAVRLRALQPLRPLLADADRASAEAAEAVDAVARADAMLDTARRAVEDATARHGMARRRFEAACTAQERATPDLDRAADLDGRIAALAGERADTDKAVTMASRRSATLRRAIEDTDIALSAAKADAARLEAWLARQGSFAAVATQWDRWDGALARHGNAMAEREAARGDRSRRERDVEAGTSACEGLETRLAAARDRCAAAGRQVDMLRTEAVPDLDATRTARAGAEQRRDGLQALLATGEARYRVTTDRQAAEAERSRLQTDEIEAEAALHGLGAELLAQRAAVEEADRALQRLLVAQREDVAGLRRRLVADEPCPVCGSDAHPWAGEESTPLARVARDQDHRLAELRDQLTRLVSRQATHEAALQAARRGADALAGRLAMLDREAEDVALRWSEQVAVTGWDSGADGVAGIRGAIGMVQDRLRAIAEDEDRALDHRKRLDAALEGLRREEAAATALSEEGEAARRRLAEGRQALALADAATERAEAGRQAALAELEDALAGEAGWRQRIEEDPDGFRAALARRVTEHRGKAEWLARAAREVERATGERAVQAAELMAAGRAEEEMRSRAADLGGRLEEARTARAALLGGQAVMSVRKQLAEERQAAEALVEKATMMRQDATGRLSAAERDRETRGEAAHRCAAKVEAARLRLDQATAERSVGIEDLRRLLATPESEIAAEERALAILERARGDAALLVAERRRLRADHHAAGRPDLSAEDAAMAAEAVLERLERERDRLGSARGRLEADDANRQRLAGLAAAIEAQKARCELWSRLAQVIGSANGQKMRNFAQSLSLDLLLSHANRHLEDLARRYRLERVAGADLEIQVVDREMGDERRGVHSLSGGELFLVSLALALGLSAMAAGTSGGIGTLFIDEGFGTLDPDSLDVALSCLEALQASGRQVGVISHVPAMVERIGTQIRVVPLGGGRSRVRVEAAAGLTAMVMDEAVAEA